ncbi:MAG: hypothetical protein IKX56_09425, partial [Muribaculaceae bacterium]|nr:hypothetical protein [Muribaculaceae bacterium]
SKGIGFQQFLPKVNFVYEPTTSAVCSKPKNLTVGRVNATTIECGWTPGGDETLWEVAWGYENFDPDDNTTWISHSVAPYNPSWIFDFTPDMTYVFAVRAVCDQDLGIYSNWTCPVVFTLETCPTPTNVTITDITTTEATVNWEGIGDTWITLYRGNYEMSTGFETLTLEGWTSESSVGNAAWTVGTGDYQTSPGTHSGSYNAKITHTTTGNETWLISPMMDLAGIDIAYLDFWYINRSWSGDVDELGVYYRIDGGDWNPLFLTAEAHGTWTNERVDLADLATHDNCQIGFKMTDHYGYGVGLDDIQISGYKFAGSYVAYSPAQSITLTNLNPNTTYTFYMRPECDGVAGTATDWMYFTTEDTAVTQTIELAAGYNWVSFYVEAGDPIELLDMLKTSLGDNGLSIEANGLGTIYDGVEWFGDLDYEGIYNEQMYLIEVNDDCTVELQGTPADPANYEFNIQPGYNWVGFPSSVEVSVVDALADFEAEEEDMIEGPDGVLY